MPHDDELHSLATRTVEAFNTRRYAEAAKLTSVALEDAVGREEVFWLGMREMCRGFEYILAGDLRQAEPLLIGAMERLRNFGYRHRGLEVTSALAGLRRGLEEIQDVQGKRKRIFDVSLLPKLKLSASADA